MDPIIMIVGLLGSLLTLGFASVAWGTDSRECLPDAHRR
jgi:hypothetical protein